MRQYRIKQTAAAPPPSSPGLSIARTANSQYRRRRLPAEPPLAEERNSKRRRTADTKGPGLGIGIAGGGASTSTTTTGGGEDIGSSRGISISGTAAPKQPERRPAQHDGQGPRTQAPTEHGDASADATSDGASVGRQRSVFGYQMQQALRSRMRDTAVSAAGAGGTPMQQSTSSSCGSGHDAGSRRNQPGAGIAIAMTARKRPSQVRKSQEQSSPRPS
ncbi:hypothetical protein EV177_001901 [Coemansia sp. RSA 1804]|nr:hypothetical protein EV177_001901 [Coemansia sp. RSA 1804]